MLSTENAATPYSATVLINGMQYGTGVGSSKKAAKAEAAKATLEVLIPEMKEKILDETEPGNKGPTHQSDPDLSVAGHLRFPTISFISVFGLVLRRDSHRGSASGRAVRQN